MVRRNLCVSFLPGRFVFDHDFPEGHIGGLYCRGGIAGRAAACPLGRGRVQPAPYASFTRCEPAQKELFVRKSKSSKRFEEALHNAFKKLCATHEVRHVYGTCHAACIPHINTCAKITHPQFYFGGGFIDDGGKCKRSATRLWTRSSRSRHVAWVRHPSL